MATPNKELMIQARQSLEGKWGVAIGTTLLYIVFERKLTTYFIIDSYHYLPF